MLLYNRKYQRSGSDVDRTARGMIVEARRREIADRVSTLGVVAVGVGPTREERPGSAAIFAFFSPPLAPTAGARHHNGQVSRHEACRQRGKVGRRPLNR